MVSLRNNSFVEIISGLFIFLFTYTSLTKLMNASAFIATLKRSPLLADVAAITAWTIILAELIVVLLLFYSPLRTAGFITSFILMLFFTVYIGYMLVSASSLPCSCGGILQQLSWRDHFLLNIALTILAALGLYLQRKKLNPKQPALI
ncbi:MAG TPA: MauE/DoxX family redox-associated membrane protein [Chitinophagaceae bacterium]|nr:MauE/DoxX family redox-associated membrane protein [Chitinophagaceae bacterium]